MAMQAQGRWKVVSVDASTSEGLDPCEDNTFIGLLIRFITWF